MIDNLWVISEKFEQTNDFLVCIDSYECFQVAHKRCLSAYRRCFFSKYGQFRANSVEMMSLTEARGNVPPVTVHKLTCVPGVHNYAHHLTICRFALPCMVSHILWKKLHCLAMFRLWIVVLSRCRDAVVSFVFKVTMCLIVSCSSTKRKGTWNNMLLHSIKITPNMMTLRHICFLQYVGRKCFFIVGLWLSLTRYIGWNSLMFVTTHYKSCPCIEVMCAIMLRDLIRWRPSDVECILTTSAVLQNCYLSFMRNMIINLIMILMTRSLWV